jgi:hypothetical protein
MMIWTWFLNPKNALLTMLAICVIGLGIFGGIQYVRVAEKAKEIEEQKSTITIQKASILSLEAQKQMLEVNLSQVQAAQKRTQAWANSTKKLAEEIRNLNTVKETTNESKIYSDLFDLFKSDDPDKLRGDSSMPGDKASKDILPQTDKAK